MGFGLLVFAIVFYVSLPYNRLKALEYAWRHKLTDIHRRALAEALPSGTP